MDSATLKQKAYIRDLFLQCGVPDWVFKSAEQWKINKEEASGLIQDLKILLKHYSRRLKDHICQVVDRKNMVKMESRTVDQMKKSVDYPFGEEFPETWREQLGFYNIDPDPEPYKVCQLEDMSELKDYMDGIL